MPGNKLVLLYNAMWMNVFHIDCSVLLKPHAMAKAFCAISFACFDF